MWNSHCLLFCTFALPFCLKHCSVQNKIFELHLWEQDKKPVQKEKDLAVKGILFFGKVLAGDEQALDVQQQEKRKK